MFAPSARLGNNGKKSDACCEHKSPDALRNAREKSGECGQAGGGERTCDGIAEVVDHQNPSDARLVGAVRKVLRSQTSTQLLNDVQKLFVHRKRFGFILFFIFVFTISLSPLRGGRNGRGPPIRETSPLVSQSERISMHSRSARGSFGACFFGCTSGNGAEGVCCSAACRAFSRASSAARMIVSSFSCLAWRSARHRCLLPIGKAASSAFIRTLIASHLKPWNAVSLGRLST